VHWIERSVGMSDMLVSCLLYFYHLDSACMGSIYTVHPHKLKINVFQNQVSSGNEMSEINYFTDKYM
jgi:hypothetical protein